MTGAPYPANMAAHGLTRSLDQVLADLRRRYDALPMQHPERARLATSIRDVEAAIDERAPA